MQQLKCRKCGTPHQPGDGDYCFCGGRDFDLETSEQPSGLVDKVAHQQEAPGIPGSERTTTSCACENKHDDGNGICKYCDHPILSGVLIEKFTVKWPWGESPIQERLLIGRVPPAPEELARNLELSHLNVSRCHAELFIESGQLYLRDLYSLNGTFLNGSQVAKFCAVLVKPGDRVRFAATLEAAISDGQ